MNPFVVATPGFSDFLLDQATPAIVYDLPKIRRTAAALMEHCSPFGGECYFSVKANRTPRVLTVLAECGFGADIASAAEFVAAFEAGHSAFVATGPALDIDTFAEVSRRGGTLFFDSLEQIRAARHRDLDVSTHGVRVSIPGAYHRFGLTPGDIALLEFEFGWTPSKFHFHYGEIATLEALSDLLSLVDDVLGRFGGDLVDLGGGYGVLSNDLAVLQAAFELCGDFAKARGVQIAFEFGKVAIARCASLITTVTTKKHRDGVQFLTVDASAYNLGTFERRTLRRWERPSNEATTTIAGSSCYEGDMFINRQPAPISAVGDKVAFGLCGAYAASLAGSLHGLPAPREVFFEG